MPNIVGKIDSIIPDKTAEELEEERRKYQQRLAILRSNISDLTKEKENYEKFRNDVSDLSSNLKKLSGYLNNSSNYLEDGLVISNVPYGRDSISSTIKEVNGYSSTLGGYLSSIDSKILEISNDLTSKENELRRLIG